MIVWKIVICFLLDFWTTRIVIAVNLSTCVEEDHSTKFGVNIECCDGASNSRKRHLHCSPAVSCQCHVEILPELNCVELQALDNDLLTLVNLSTNFSSVPLFGANGTAAVSNCSDLGFRNFGAEYSVHIRDWSQRRNAELLDGLSKYNVTKLTLNIQLSYETSNAVEIPNFGLFFPELRHLFISTIFAKKSAQILRAKLATTQFLRDLRFLKSLKMINVDFEFDESEEASWIASIQQIHVEGSSFSGLPWWFGRAAQLERLTIRHSRLKSALVASQIPSISYLNLAGNRVGDLDKISFASTRIHEMDLAGNRITKFAFHTFSQCLQLRRLDLSDNPIDGLPEKAFYANLRLKTLRIENTQITDLGATHFIGLSGLRSLTLSGNFLRNIETFAFLPIRSVRSLAMNRCNLTSIPLAVTQCCHLERDSMPEEALAMLSKLRHFDFARNPLIRLPPGLFLFPIELENVYSNVIMEIVENLIELPVWLSEPCTPFFWYLHLRNSSSYDLRARLSLWDEKRMHRDKLTHCQQLYKTTMDSISLYTELVMNSGCEATRRLRSVITANHQNQCWSGNDGERDSMASTAHKKQRHQQANSRVIVKNLNDKEHSTGKKFEKVHAGTSLNLVPSFYQRGRVSGDGSGTASTDNRSSDKYLQRSANHTLECIMSSAPHDFLHLYRNLNFALIVSITMNFVLLILITSLFLHSVCQKRNCSKNDYVDQLTPLKRDINVEKALYSQTV